jgi:hypothetical protein
VAGCAPATLGCALSMASCLCFWWVVDEIDYRH